MNRIYVIILVLGLAAVLFFLLGSGGGDSEGQLSKDGIEKRDDAATGKRKDTTANDKQNTFRIPITSNPPTLDPVQITDVTSHVVASKLFNQLVRYNSKMELIPDLATEIPEFNTADNSYTFKLRKGVKFHDGRVMTARDLKYSWERLLDPAVSKRFQILAGVLGAMEKVKGKGEITETKGLKVIDDHTFKVTLASPRPTFLHEIIMVNTAVIPTGAAEAAKAKGSRFRNQPIGTGPFKLTVWEENARIEMARHEDYFKGKPPLDGVVFEIIPKPEMRVAKFLKGEFEVCDIPFGQFKSLKAQHPDLLCENETFRTNYLGSAMRILKKDGTTEVAEPLGSRLELRQAINHAIDRENISNVILEGRGKPAQSILPPNFMGHNRDLRGWEYSPKKAKEILAKAGFPEGKGLRPLSLFHRNDPDTKRICLAIQSDLQAVGFQIKLQALDWAAFLDRVDNNPPDLFYLGWVADYNDADNFLYWLFHTSQWGDPGNHTRYSNKKVDALLEKARISMDRDERVKLYNQAEEMIVRDLAWCLLYYKKNYILMQPYVKNAREQILPLDVDPGLGMVDFGKVRFER